MAPRSSSMHDLRIEFHKNILIGWEVIRDGAHRETKRLTDRMEIS
jgi:hypothetical protein